MNKEKNFISAVVYVHNQEQAIGAFLKMLDDTLQTYFDKYEIICVDDDSTDQGVAEIKKQAALFQKTSVTVLHMSYFQGREMSMNAGVDVAIGDFVLEFDKITVEYAPEVIFKVYQKSLEGYDIVSAVPEKKEKISSRIFYFIYNKVTTNQYMLRTETFHIISRRGINRIHSMNKTIPYRKAVYANCGLQCTACIYEIIINLEGSSKESKEDKRARMDLAVNSLILFTNAAYRFATLMTLLMMAITCFAAVYAIVIFLTGSPIAGWTTTILFLSFAFFGLFGILTIVIKYLSTIVDLIFKKQKYIFESIEKI